MSDTNGVMGQEAIAVLNHWQAKVGRLRQCIKDQQDEIERLRADAKRYQFLRELDDVQVCVEKWTGDFPINSGRDLDKVIDAAIKEVVDE